MTGPTEKPLRGRCQWLASVAVCALAAGLGVAATGVAPRAHAAGILTQGVNPAMAPVTSSVTAALAAEQQGSIVAAQAQNQLSRITNALTAMQNLQTSARNLAITTPSSVPDGLQSGGLAPVNVSSWTGAQAPSQASVSGQTTVTVNQTAAQALLSWNSFNVGKNTTLNFNQQGNTNWVALNRVVGTTAPSQILGSIKASGQVYVINQNGVIFGGASQINVGSLIASSAMISNAQFSANGIYSPENGTIYTPSFTGAGGAIVVEPGAQITTNTPAAVTSGGGFVLMMGTQVQNAGSITTPDGQTELAAGDNFLIRSGYSTSSNVTSTTRGNEIAVQLNTPGSSLSGGSGIVINTGAITAATGDITLAGETVEQNGVALSTTSVAVRGTIHLLSSASDKFSSVTLGSNADTLIEPELSSTATELDSQRAALIADSATANGGRSAAFNPQFDDISLLDDQQESSRIEIVTDGAAHFADGSDSSAPGGQLAVSAIGRIQVDTGALLDVSGSTGVALAMASNDIAVNIQNNELRDDPQNRLTQNLRSATVYVDTRTLSVVPASVADMNIREYTAGGLLEVSGYVANAGHTIGEYTAIGGSIDLSAGPKGAIVAQTGSVFNIDGGTLHYKGGELQQSYLLGSDGRIYNVNDAPSDITYAGVFGGYSIDHSAWNVTQTYGDVLKAPSEIYQPGYTVGRAAGSLTLSSPTTIFNGDIHAATVNGPAQIAADPAGTTDPYLLTQAEVAEPGSLYIEAERGGAVSAIDSDVIFAAAKTANVSIDGKIKARNKNETLIDGLTLDKSGLGAIQVVTNGSIGIAAPLSLAPGGTVNLYGSSVDIGADITAAGGSVSAGQVTTLNGNQVTLQVPKVKSRDATGDTVVEKGVIVSTAGLWTNLLTNPNITFTQAFINGGAISLGSVNSLILRGGSVIDTSAGGAVSVTGVAKGGSGGAITLAAATASADFQNPRGDLVLHGSLDAVGTTQGGALTLAASAFLITAKRPAKVNPNTTVLDPALFQSGFSAYNLQSTGNIVVASGTVVNVLEPTYQASSANLAAPTGTAPAGVFTLALDPLYVPNSTYTAITQRPGASFNAEVVLPNGELQPTAAVSKSKLMIGDKAGITVDPGQAINLAAIGQITIDGRLTAPGGTISAVSDYEATAAEPNGPGTVSVWVGPKAVLNASASAASFENAAGTRISTAPAGGTITLGSTSSTASVIILQGAVIAASGSAATDALSASGLAVARNTAQPAGAVIPVAGAGGSISLASAEGIYNTGTLAAAAGGASAAGGSLSIALEADLVPNSAGTLEATPRIITISQAGSGSPLPVKLKPGQSAGLSIGTASVSAAQIIQGGFGNVTLFARDAFLFDGNVTLSAPQSITLEEGYDTDTSASGSVTLSAPYVTLAGQTFDTYTVGGNNPNENLISETLYSAQSATGSFTVNAATLDIDNALRFGGVLPADGAAAALDLAGFATVDLNSSGDIQFIPYNKFGGASVQLNDIVTTADVNLTAREIYAIGATGSQTNGVAGTTATVIAGFNPVATSADGNYNPNGTLNIYRAAGTTPVAPDTLLGSLTFEAATVNQGGVIWQPLGSVTFGNVGQSSAVPVSRAGDPNTAVNFLPGSITSVSAAGLNIPFGGTTDGVNYDVNGQPIASTTNAKFGLQTVTNGAASSGSDSITIQAQTTNIESGAKIDLQGGGTLTGAGFISGEGGSTNVLTTPLLQTTPTGVTQPSLSTDPVYAIVAGVQPIEAVAYTQSGASGSTPGLGAQIVIPAGIPGLPAGTYTLLPASYATEPGGYRVELDGAAALDAAAVTRLGNGSYAVAGYAARANTNVRSTLASNLTITPAATVLNYSQYDQESYSAFLQATAAKFGAVRPVLPIDAGTLVLNVPISSGVSITNNGSVSFDAANGGIGGTLQISGDNTSGAEPDLDIYGAAPVAGLAAGTVALSAAQIDAFHPFILEIGVGGGGGTGAKVNSITLENGAVLKAARIVLTALTGGITLDGGSSINTINQGTLLADSSTEGQLSNNGASVLDVGNGYLVYGTNTSTDTNYGPITVQSGASIETEGSIAFSTSQAVNIDAGASYGGKYLDLAVPEINIGNPQGLRATAPPGLLLTPAVLQTLTQGIPADGVPAVQILNLTAFNALNFYGTAGLDLAGSNVELEINTPAIYGFGGAGAVASIGASTIVWNGIATTAANGMTIVSSLPGGTVANGPGSGNGTLDLNAQNIILGYSNLDVPQNDVSLSRLTAGFSAVNFNASSEITANNQGSLAVYQSVPQYGQAGTGGTLSLNTPLLTADNGAIIGFTAGGVIDVGLQAGNAAASQVSEAAGGEIDLNAAKIAITGSVILPSGKLDLQASGDIDLGAASLIRLAGVATTNIDQTIYGFGGDLIMASAGGNITQNAGSVIDVSAVNNRAGSITVAATGANAGQVALNGTLNGGTSGVFAGNAASGVFDINAQSLGNALPLTAGFMALNASLDRGGFFQSRNFDLQEQQAALTISSGLKAHNIAVSVDNGSLTVDGLVDASGNGGGAISLAATAGLTLTAAAVLDAHGTVLQTDSYGVPIASENAAVISLTSGKGAVATGNAGELILNGGAQIDLTSADGVARGDLELNVPRLTSATSGDADIAVTGPVTVTGAASIAVNAFASYSPTDPDGSIVQDNGSLAPVAPAGSMLPGAPAGTTDAGFVGLDQINTADTVPFMTAAATNTDLAARLSGLSAYAAALHVRPGVQIVSATSTGNLSVAGDLDLAGYRYGAGSPGSGGAYGGGQPGVLDLRAGGNLNIFGSITDGFEQPISDVGTEFANGWVIYGGEPYNQNQVIPVSPTAIAIAPGTTFPDGVTLNFNVPIEAGTFQAGAIVPAGSGLTLTSAQTVTTAFIATSNITNAAGHVIYMAKQIVPAGSVIPTGATIAPGGVLPFAIDVGPVTWPAGTPITVATTLTGGGTAVMLAAVSVKHPDTVLAAGALIPAGSALIFAKTDAGLTHGADGNLAFVDSRSAGTDGSQGQLYGLASLLPTGDQSWSIALVSGADTAAASTDVTLAANALGAAGNLTLADTHYGVSGTSVVPAFSVIRTGTGSLSLISGGAINEDSAFGAYTAGDQSAAIGNQSSYDLAQGDQADGTVLGPKNAGLAMITDYAANYPTNGGNVLVAAQGDLNGFISTSFNANSGFKGIEITDTDAVGEWLWQQGGADGQPAAWWIEYGALTPTGSQGVANKPYVAQYTGFQGIGTLGGGNLTVNAGGTAQGLDLAVASNGRVQTDGTLVQDGGGALNVKIGDAINAIEPGSGQIGNTEDAGGIISDLRGATHIDAGSIGMILPQYGLVAAGDPRFLPPLQSETAELGQGIDLAPGDSAVSIDTRGDLAIGSAINPGTVQNYVNVTPAQITQNGVVASGEGVTDFSLWTGSTSIGLFSAGGNVAPAESAGSSGNQNDSQQNFYPASLLATAQNGNIYFGTLPVELAPSSNGQLQLLAADSIIGDSSIVAMSSAALNLVATPFNPGITVFSASGTPVTNHNPNSLGSPIDFGVDTPSSALHAADPQPALIYAAGGDILDIQFGKYAPATSTTLQAVAAAKPLEIDAGRDIVDSGTIASPDILLNLRPTDISTVTAGRDIIESSFDIAGPGVLVVQAGRNYYAADQGVIDSIGPIFDIDPNNRNSGAGVALLAGVGSGPDYGNFADEFLAPDGTLNLSDASAVVQDGDAALFAWLKLNFGYSGTEAGAYPYFKTLTASIQDVFLRGLYFAALDASGLQFNNPDSDHPKSYIFGKTAIAALFPAADYAGDITLFGGSGVHTDFGGNIETLTPGGATTIGVEGTTPPGSAGFITQGNGDIDIYALDSVELGESRVLTTFGGNIVIWSAQGDINAGRGSKTTIDYTLLQRLYDHYGNISLSPTVPSSGAGIATLNPIPSVPAGNIDLVAPLGTVDAGEAGIRGSGNLNIAALHVLNAANINVQGVTTSSSTVAAPNVGALTSTSNAAGAAAQAAESTTTKNQAAPLPTIWIVEILGYGGGSNAGQPMMQTNKHAQKFE